MSEDLDRRSGSPFDRRPCRARAPRAIRPRASGIKMRAADRRLRGPAVDVLACAPLTADALQPGYAGARFTVESPGVPTIRQSR